jgi:hypothetical protein
MSHNTRPRISPQAAEIIDAASSRLGISAAAVVDYLARRYGPKLKPPLDPKLLPPDHRGVRGGGRRKKV